MRPLMAAVVSGGLLCTAAPAAAEVWDKVLSVEDMWFGSMLLVGIILLAGAWKRRLGYALWAIGSLTCWGPILEWHDPYVGPAILRELGAAWGWHAYGSTALVTVAPGVVFGMLAWRRRRRRAAA